MFEKKVELVAWLQNPKTGFGAEDAASCGARGCFSEKSSADIFEDEKALSLEKYEARKETIFEETSGRGHGAVLDHSEFLFSIDNLSRASTLLLCEPEFAAHLQQSLRRTSAERGFHIPKYLAEDVAKTAEKLMRDQFSLYEKMQSSKAIPAEDSRFILPLYAKTAIQTKWNARELMHLHSMALRPGVPSEAQNTIEQMVSQATEVAPKLMKRRNTNYEALAWFPSSQLFAPTNKTLKGLIKKYGSEEPFMLSSSGIPMLESEIEKAVMQRDEAELANLKHYHFTILAPMSVATFHQATRQRTWNQSVESLLDAVNRGNNYIIPPSIRKSAFLKEYSDLAEESIAFARNYPLAADAIGVVPHALQVYDLIHVNGWNAVHSIGKRTCTEAQWEIRGIANSIAKYINKKFPEIGKYSVPQGITYGRCPERNSCGKCKSE